MTATTVREASATGWHDDPTGRYRYRYWDGASWTSTVSDGVASAVDPLNTVQTETSSNQASALQATKPAAAAGQSKLAIAAAAVIAVTLAVFVVVIFVAAVGAGPADDDSIAGNDAPVVTESPIATTAP